MCFCDETNPARFCGAVECFDPNDPLGLDLDSQAPECPHPTLNIEKRLHRFEETGRQILEVRLRCAECKAPFLFDGLPKVVGTEVDLNQPATTDLTGRVGRFVIKPEGGVG